MNNNYVTYPDPTLQYVVYYDRDLGDIPWVKTMAQLWVMDSSCLIQKYYEDSTRQNRLMVWTQICGMCTCLLSFSLYKNQHVEESCSGELDSCMSVRINKTLTQKAKRHSSYWLFVKCIL